MKNLWNVTVTVITSTIVTVLMFMFLNSSFKDVKPLTQEASTDTTYEDLLVITHEYVEPEIDISSNKAFILSMNKLHSSSNTFMLLLLECKTTSS